MRENLSEKAKENIIINESIHDRIRKWLEEHERIDTRTPETKIAERLGCDYIPYAKQISNGKAISLQELITYAESLGCSTDYLLGISLPPEKVKKYTDLENLVRAILLYDAFTPESSCTCTRITIERADYPEKDISVGFPTVTFGYDTRYYFQKLGALDDLGGLFYEYTKIKNAFEYLTEEQCHKLIDDLINKYFHPFDNLPDLPFK